MMSLMLDYAIPRLQKALRLDPRNVEIRVAVAVACEMLGKLDVAIDEYRRALTFDPRHERTRANLAAAIAMREKD